MDMRDAFRKALDESMPPDPTWREDEKRLLARLARRPVLFALPAAPVLCAVLFMILRAPPATATTTEIYLRAASDAEADAIHITLTTSGVRP